MNDRTVFKKLFIFLFVLVACQKNGVRELPSLAIEGRVSTSVQDLTLLNTPNSFLILQNQGTNGVVVFNTGATGPFQFRAFELSCPYISPSVCNKRMSVDNSGVMRCDGCADDAINFTHFKTKVTVEEGGEEKDYYLVEYNAVLQGQSIRITNFQR